MHKRKETVKYKYEVYALKGDREKDLFAFEGPCNNSNLPTLSELPSDVRHLSGILLENHCGYLIDAMEVQSISMPWEKSIFLAFSYDPPSEAVAYSNRFWKTRRLTEKEQEEFQDELVSCMKDGYFQHRFLGYSDPNPDSLE